MMTTIERINREIDGEPPDPIHLWKVSRWMGPCDKIALTTREVDVLADHFQLSTAQREGDMLSLGGIPIVEILTFPDFWWEAVDHE